MADIMNIIESSNNANIKFEISSEDLKRFADELVHRTVNEVTLAMRYSEMQKMTEDPQDDQTDETLLTKEDVKRFFGVCDSTLWHWERKGYLVPIRIGSRVRYRESDVKKYLGKT